MVRNFSKATVKKYLKAAAYVAALSAVLSVCMLFLSVQPFDISLIGVLFGDIRLVTLNFLPVLLTVLLLWFATGRMFAAFLTSSVIFYTVAIVNSNMLMIRDDPFLFPDIFLVSEAGNMMHSYTLKFNAAAVTTGTVLILCLVAAFFIKMRIRRKLRRLIGVVASAVLLVALSCLFLFDEVLYTKTWHDEFGSGYKTANQYMSHGIVYSFFNSMPDALGGKPDGYSENQAQAVLDEFDTEDLPDNKKVNIISVMLESYNDFSKFGVMDFKTDPYQNFHKLQSDGYSGNLFVNVFAGGTIDTERGFIAGFADSEIKQKPTDSFASYFKSQGYYTEAMHPGYGWFYNRKNLAPLMGFDSFLCYENCFSHVVNSKLAEEKYHGFISDHDFFDHIINGCNNAIKQNKKYFNFSVTYQNHGPYGTEPITYTDYIEDIKSIDKADLITLNNYFDGIARTDRAIEKLRDYADSSDEPIVLIFFGDHNPGLGENSILYEKLGIDITLNNVKAARNYYETPYVFYANSAAKKLTGRKFQGKGKTISPIFLMSEFFECLGAKGCCYLNYLDNIKQTTPIINPSYFVKNNKFIPRSVETGKEVIIQQKNIEYYIKNKKLR